MQMHRRRPTPSGTADEPVRKLLPRVSRCSSACSHSACTQIEAQKTLCVAMVDQLAVGLWAVQSVDHLVEYLKVRMAEGVVGTVEQPVRPEHLVAVFQGSRTVGYRVHVQLVEVELGGLVQVDPTFR